MDRGRSLPVRPWIRGASRRRRAARHLLVPHPVEPLGIDDRLADHLQAELRLLIGGARLAVELHGEAGEVPHEDVEDLVDEIAVDVVDLGVLQDQLGVDDEGEDLAERQQEVDVASVWPRRGGAGDQHGLERLDLLLEHAHVGQIETVEHGGVVVEPDLAQAPGRALVEQEVVVGRVVPAGDRRACRPG